MFYISGHQTLHDLTSRKPYELRVDLEDFYGDTAYAKYSIFRISNESSEYTLEAEGYTGTAGM